MATAILSGQIVGRTQQVQTQVTGVTNVKSAAARNVTKGPTTLYAIVADNQEDEDSNVQIFVKVYDITTEGWVPANDQGIIGFPMEQYVSTNDPNNQFASTYIVCIIPEGLPIENGISVAASKEAGDDVTTAPVTEIQVEFVHS